MRRFWIRIWVAPWFLLLSCAALAEVIPGNSLRLQGTLLDDDDMALEVSAIERLGNGHYAVGVDEGRAIQLLEECSADTCRLGPILPLREGDADDDEIDVEAMASDGRHLYVIGAHTCNRSRVKGKHSRKKNLRRLHKVNCQSSRDGLFRFELDADSGLPVGKAQHRSLRRRIHDDPVLERFETIPSKENGVDIEGLAVADGRLYVGFRGPVLRGNWVPVMVTRFDGDDHDVLWLRLGGRGVRSLARVDDGFLVLAGAVGDGDVSYELSYWDGTDCLLDDSDELACDLRHLGTLSGTDGKPEGMTVLEDRGLDGGWQLLVVYDGADNGAPRHFKVHP